MECSAYREAISARIDGEDGGLEMAAVDAHLSACPACRAWADTATTVTRSARLGLAEPVPDLANRIMAAIAQPPTVVGGRNRLSLDQPSTAARRPPAASPDVVGGGNRLGHDQPSTARRRPPAASPGMVARLGRPARGRIAPRPQAASPGMIARLGLVMVALAQGFLAIPALLGSDAGAPIHIAHEQGAWALALAVAFMAVAIQPGRAAALLPFVAALASGLALTMVIDIAAGRTQAAAEAPHGLAFLGLGMLWLLSRQTDLVARQAKPTVPTSGIARAA